MAREDKLKLFTVVGARPQFIKASALSRAIRASGDVVEVLVHTGQHYNENMSDVFFQELGMAPPDHSLGIGGGSHGAMTGQMLARIEELLLSEAPDAMVIYGDTNSTLAGALAAAKLHIPVAHIEAGLRSHNRRMPEEVNRVLADHVSEWLLCPTDSAVENLRAEGITRNVVNVGDIMFDVALHAVAAAREQGRALETLGLVDTRFVLATIHRQENTDDPVRLRNIFDALAQVGEDLPVVLPLHPRTRQRLASFGIAPARGIRLIDPVGYLDMVQLESHASLIATDSGGVQKEAFFYRVPCATLREETEWVELIEAGWNRLVDPKGSSIAADLRAALGTKGAEADLYGQGNTAAQILDVLRR